VASGGITGGEGGKSAEGRRQQQGSCGCRGSWQAVQGGKESSREECRGNWKAGAVSDPRLLPWVVSLPTAADSKLCESTHSS